MAGARRLQPAGTHNRVWADDLVELGEESAKGVLEPHQHSPVFLHKCRKRGYIDKITTRPMLAELPRAAAATRSCANPLCPELGTGDVDPPGHHFRADAVFRGCQRDRGAGHRYGEGSIPRDKEAAAEPASFVFFGFGVVAASLHDRVPGLMQPQAMGQFVGHVRVLPWLRVCVVGRGQSWKIVIADSTDRSTTVT
jgi:hypothetical protein